MALTTWILLISCSIQLFEPGYGQNCESCPGNNFTLPSTSLAFLSLGKNEWSWCAGALVSDRYVLTSAACVRERIEITLGKDASSPCLRSTYHVSNSDFISNGPLALVKLPNPAKLNQAVSIIQLSTGATCDDVRFLGWRKPKCCPDVKAYGFNVAVVGKNQCQDQYQNLNLNETNMCIERKNKQDYCIGTTGAILFHNTLKTLSGIGHRRYTGCKKDKPLIITNIKSFRPWILKTIKIDETKMCKTNGTKDNNTNKEAGNNGTATTGVPETSEGGSSTEANGTATTSIPETSEGDKSTGADGTATTGVPEASGGDSSTKANGTASR